MKRVKYISQFSRDMTRDEIDALVNNAAKKNAVLGDANKVRCCKELARVGWLSRGIRTTSRFP